ncbi:SUKH-3 domain-containing protein [Streptomyces sp. NPDC001817]|uniref:SUKH-3 domain-containing protein n=1 Tax=Streptomyces sp. NPDC001817 TaxID=3154398 RepID=UPI003331FCDD
MTSPRLAQDVLLWLTANGWSPARDIGEEAGELVRVCVQHSERQGVPLVPVLAAVHVIRTYGRLRLPQPNTPGVAWVMEPTVGYEGDAAAIMQLAAGLGTALFPVGYEATEGGLLLVDEKGRFFHLHHTGGYYLGNDEFDAFARFLQGLSDPDAEEYFV